MPRVLVVDGDNTLWRGRAAEGIGKAMFVQEIKRVHIPTVLRGLKGKKEVEALVKDLGGVEGEMQGQKRFYQVLIENGLGERTQMLRFAGEYIRTHIVDSVSVIVAAALSSDTPVFLSTASGTSAAQYARVSLFDSSLTDSRSNEEVFSISGRLTDFRMSITTGENKLHETEVMLAQYGISIGDCEVIGDSALDIPLLKSAKRPLASPYATDEVKAVRGITVLS